MENQSTGLVFPPLTQTAVFQAERAYERQGGGIRSTGTDSMSAPGARGVLLAEASALDYFLLIPAQAGINRGFRRLRTAA
ncbi:hypothetical protein, partial [Butyricicoccus pullicaecorum]|uniref:hypothetical protein n=1 Tax=Butyricicoccus pullicaecorum TaxID=501571 RepID=UPI001A9A68F8